MQKKFASFVSYLFFKKFCFMAKFGDIVWDFYTSVPNIARLIHCSLYQMKAHPWKWIVVENLLCKV